MGGNGLENWAGVISHFIQIVRVAGFFIGFNEILIFL
jgi:hypothetical protein